MSTAARHYDLFLIRSAADIGIAREVEEQLSTAGFNVFHDVDEVGIGERIDDRIRDAIYASDAVVMLITPSSQNSENVFIELGAATAWDKPIFVVRSGVSTDDLPASLRSYPSYPIAELKSLAGSLAERLDYESMRLSDDEQAWLAKAYATSAVPIDALDYRQLQSLSSRILRKTGKRIAPESIMQQLIRMRKLGRLSSVGKMRRE